MADRDKLDLDAGMSILSVYDADGYLGIGVDVPGYETAGTSTFEARFPYGTFGRPRDPDVSVDRSARIGATVLFGYAGRDRHAWPLDDPRVWPKLPQLPKGSWGAYADTAREELPVMVLDGATGSFAVRVPHSTGGGVASRVLVDVETPGAEEIVLAHGAGPYLKVIPTGVEVKDGELRVGPDLLHAPAVKGNSALQAWITQVTALINLIGAQVPVPPPALPLVAPSGYLASFTFIS